MVSRDASVRSFTFLRVLDYIHRGKIRQVSVFTAFDGKKHSLDAFAG